MTHHKLNQSLTKRLSLRTVLASSMALLSAGSASAASFLIDFNTFQFEGGYVGGESAWNIYATPSNVTGTIKDSTGSTAAGYTLGYTGNLEDTDHSNYFSNATGGASWATTDGSLANTQAVGDYFRSNGSGTPAIFTFGGLTAGATISLDLFSAFNFSNTAARGQYSYSIDGGTTYIGFDIVDKDGTLVTAGGAGSTYFNGNSQGNDAAYYMNISSLTVGASGNLLVKAQDNGNFGEFAVISAMQLTVVPVPEPSAALLGLIGSSLLLVRRRR